MYGSHMTDASNWRPKARCKQLSGIEADQLFYPQNGRTINEAKRFCRGCEVIVECGEEALDLRIESGIWGGMSEKERRTTLRFRDELNNNAVPDTGRKKKRRKFTVT